MSGHTGMRDNRSAAITLRTTLLLACVLVTLTLPTNAAALANDECRGASHLTVFSQSLVVLAADGYWFVVNAVLKDKDGLSYERSIVDGLIAADSGFSAQMNHYQDPAIHVGYQLVCKSAAALAREQFERAVSLYGTNKSAAFYYLGMALHLVQDLTVPYHADVSSKMTLAAHSEYETWLLEHGADHVSQTESGGIYSFVTERGAFLTHHSCSDAGGWVDYAAHCSSLYLSSIKGVGRVVVDKQQAASVLVPLAVRLSAGFLRFFYASVDGESCLARPMIPLAPFRATITVQ